MGEEVRFTYKRGSKITPEEIAMIEAASTMPVEYDDENPEIDPVKTPELYAALVRAVAERNQRISKRQA